MIGSYGGSKVGTGEKRIGVTWTRIIFPDNRSVLIGNMAGIDLEGYPGLHDKVDNHSRELYRGAFLSSIFAAGAMAAAGGNGSDNRSPGQEAVAGAATNILNIGQKQAERNLDISPTIMIRPGTQFAIFVNQDLVLEPYY